ncbi:UNVERIFIED_CONTAM: hypothetical protein K2H54_009929 [Gekko kuhli]
MGLGEGSRGALSGLPIRVLKMLSAHSRHLLHLEYLQPLFSMPISPIKVKAELHKQWSRFLLAYPFVCLPWDIIKFLGRCPKKSKKRQCSLEMSQPQSMQMAKQRSCCSVELSPTWRPKPRKSSSDSSEEVTVGETTEVLEESEI